MPHKIYSIESRKGGVGKTTVAHNLASLLVKRGPVLLLDCDITGTSIADPAKYSTFWNSETNVLTYEENNGESKDINLIRFFLEHFIKGEGDLSSFINQKKLSKSKINILSSFLYGISKEAAINSSWLQEELHSYWMVELVQRIITEFESLFPDMTVSIIIDNSPGYTTFIQALHNYLYKEGPINAKYLLVSTLDSQDLMANIETADEIYQSVKNRMIAAEYYKLKEKDEKDTLRDTGAETLIEADGEIKDFFLQLIDNNQLLETYAKSYGPGDFLAMVLNKIPQSLQDDGTSVAYEEIVGNRLHFLSQIAGSDGNSDPRNLVYYDDAIVYQYFFSFLRGRRGLQPSSTNYWNRRLRDIRQQVDDASKLLPLSEMAKLTTIYKGLRKSLLQHGHAQIGRQMAVRWVPDSIIDELEERISSTASGTKFSSDIPFQRMKGMLHLRNRELLTEIKDYLRVQDHEIDVLSNLMEHLESYAGINEEKKRPEQMILVSLLFISLFNSLQLARNDIFSKPVSLSEYLKYERGQLGRDVVDVKHGIKVSSELTLHGDWLEKVLKRGFDRVYSLFTYTILKLIEQNKDFNFILDAVSLYVPSPTALSFSNEMKDYITDVVAFKRKEHDVERLAEIRAKSYVMENMQDVLRNNILKSWK